MEMMSPRHANAVPGAASSSDPVFQTGAKITDRVQGEAETVPLPTSGF